MLTITLGRRATSALKAIEESQDLLDVLAKVNDLNEQVDRTMLGLAEGGGNKIPESASSIHSQIASLSAITRKLSVRKLFRSVESLESALKESLVDGAGDSGHIVEILSELDEFAEAYNVYVAHQVGANALPLLRVSRRLERSLVHLRGFLKYVGESIGASDHPESSESEFVLVLSRTTGLKDFSERLDCIQVLYEEICFVMDISVASHPLRVAKIESGSLLTRLFGDTRAIGMLVGFVEGAVRYLHRNYTSEGRISSVPRKVEALDELLSLSERLKANGVNVDDLQKSLAKNAVVISNNLNRLLSDQPVVEVNGEVLSVGSEIQKALLEQAGFPEIEYSAMERQAPQLPPPTKS